MKNLVTAAVIFLSAVSVLFGQSSAPLWMRYPAISPDGKAIAFSYKGNIYTVPATGGKATMLTSHVAYDFSPVWSPDGKQIAFASDRHGNFDVFVVSAEGGVPERLTYNSGGEVPASFSPDGKQILFQAALKDLNTNYQFPTGALPELYAVTISTKKIDQILTTTAESAKWNANASTLIYHDNKGYENKWRKHHTSSVARDVWMFDKVSGKHTMLTEFVGEDREPVFSADNKTVYYLTEQFGNNFNIASFALSNPKQVIQLTDFKKHPVRFLTSTQNNTLCFGYDGEIYTMAAGQKPAKVNIEIRTDENENLMRNISYSNEATEMAVSPDGKEVAFIVRGEVYTTSVEYGTTKRITNTPEQERSVSYSPDGRTLLYASERKGSWNLYTTTIVREQEKSFTASTLLKEEALREVPEENFQPSYSPDGKEVAFLEERTTLKVINLATKQVRTILDGKWNYSYSDGDQWYQWSPDGKWFLVNYSPDHLFRSEAALVDAEGKQTIKNLTESGYNDNNPKWMLGGKAMLWFTDRHGMRSHGSWGSQYDVYAMYFDQIEFDKFKMTAEELERFEEANKKDKKEEPAKDAAKTDDKKKAAEPNKEPAKSKDLKFDFNGLEDRIARLTIHSSAISDAVLTPDGKKLYYICRFEKDNDLWMHDFKKNETKLVTKLGARGGAGMEMDKDGKTLFVFAGGRMMKISTSDHVSKPINYNADFEYDYYAEKAYMFEHAWRQVQKKWYKTDLHGVDWAMYKTEYLKFLPHINNNYDYAEMLSEMLGELNGSHTGSSYRGNIPNADQTASLGIFYDWNYTGQGVKITEIIDKSPLMYAEGKATAGTVITAINGEKVRDINHYFEVMNKLAGKNVLVAFENGGKTWDETIKPIGLGTENQLLYERWVKIMQKETERLSGGKIGYVHVRGMDDGSFRTVYSDIFGKNAQKEALVVDTRFNGGGWLHDNLAVLLGGEKYVTYVPREQKMGYDPMDRWFKPTILLMSESNYSDAHAFPYVYTQLKLGKTVGMPVPGTMTAVWWENMIDQTVNFGIPQVGSVDMAGDYLENKQLNPDIQVRQDYDVIIKARDQQLERAVQELLKK